MQESAECYTAGYTDSYTDGLFHLEQFQVKSKQILHNLRVAYRLHGDRSLPVCIALGGISAHRGLNSPAHDLRAWWPQMVGAGRAINTEKFCVLSFDYLGGSAASSGPHDSNWPEQIEITTDDQANIAFALCQHLQIKSISHWVGASYGGMVGLSFAKNFPNYIERLTLISAAHRAHPMAMAWRYIQREIVALGKKTGETKRSLALARALAMTTYRSPEEFGQRFQEFAEVTSYLEHTGQCYAEVTHEQSFQCLSASIDTHLVEPGKLKTDLEIIGFWEDRLVPAEILQELAQATGAKLRLFHSVYGHDAFLKEVELFTELLQNRGESL